jgi:hypothetical protein
MFTGLAIFGSVFLWLMVKEKGFRRVVFIGIGVVAVLAAVIGGGVAIWYYGIHAPAEARKAKQEESARKQTTGQYTIADITPDVTPTLKLTPDPPAKEPDGYVKTDPILYGDYDLSGRAVGTAETNDMVKIIARNNIYSTLRVKDVHNGLLGWISEDNVQIVTLKPVPTHAGLSPCPSNDPLGLRSANPCQPLSPRKGAAPCPESDPIGLNTALPCAPSPSQSNR